MPAKKKKQLVEELFHSYLRESKIALYPFGEDAFEECWNKVTGPLRKKLNSRELFEYIRIHILPSLVTPALPTASEYYRESIRKQTHSIGIA